MNMTGVLIKTKFGYRDRHVQGEKERSLQQILPSSEGANPAGVLISDFLPLEP